MGAAGFGMVVPGLLRQTLGAKECRVDGEKLQVPRQVTNLPPQVRKEMPSF